MMGVSVNRAMAGAALLLAVSHADATAAAPIRIVLVEDDTGAAGARHGEAGFRFGLEVATASTQTAASRPLVLAVTALGGDPAARLRAAYGEGKADIVVSLAGAAATRAMLPEAAAAHRILLVAAATAEDITGAASNRYVFRTAASDREIVRAAVLAYARPQQNLMVAAPDTPAGHAAAETVKAVLEERQTGAFFVGIWTLPTGGEGLLDIARAQYDGLHNLHEARTLVVLGPTPPALLDPLIAADPGHYGVRIALAGALDPEAPPDAALDGLTPYHHALSHNKLNDRLVRAWQQRFQAHPDGAAADGMSAALALVAAIKAAGSAEGDALVAALEGLHVQSPKGELVLRTRDHQATQAIAEYHSETSPAGTTITLIRELPASPE
jgi:branched-chain amino acid transport system substrate-binding protein